jgi:hypothetical protein
MTDDSQWNVTLRDGSKLDGRSALADLTLLRSLSSQDPSLLHRLHNQLPHDAPIDAALTKEYDEVFFIDGKFRNSSRLVSRNAIMQTTDGSCEIVDPFLPTENNRHVLETIEQNKPIFLERLAREITNRDDDLFR